MRDKTAKAVSEKSKKFEGRYMKINKVTQLWEDLIPADISAMKTWAEDVVLRGKIAYPNPDWLVFWYMELGFKEENQRLLMQSTAVPQRVLLSIINAMELKRCQ